jgi:hypothetical protein
MRGQEVRAAIRRESQRFAARSRRGCASASININSRRVDIFSCGVRAGATGSAIGAGALPAAGFRDEAFKSTKRSS